MYSFLFSNFLLSAQNYNYFYNIKHLTYFFSNVTHLYFSRPIITELVYLWIILSNQSKNKQDMENTVTFEKPNFAKSITPYGIIFGVIMILELVIMYTLKPDPIKSGWIGTMTNTLNYLLFTSLFITLACNNFKKANGGYIKFGQCLKIGVGVCALAALQYAVFYFIFTLIFPEFIPEMIEQIKIVTVHNTPQINSEQLKMTMSIMESTMQPYFAGPITIVMYSFVGLIISLIIGAIVKKENPYGDFNPNANNTIGSEE